ncbi:MAG TPA: FAD binding domain-containing protein [Flavobacteriales bacterium]|nr:FAD binding domain-containing protein [Flavobacteriales bacterium]
MTRFILNDTLVESTAPEGTVMLDIVRYHHQLKGTKIGCREGDCGACTVLVGELTDDRVEYKSMTSCLLALANVEGKHVVTVEGLNMERLSPVQQAMVDESGTQCGFCTPGFVVSLSGCCLSNTKTDTDAALRCIDGNICRCTGYKSIERAAVSVALQLAKKDTKDPIGWSVKNGFLPAHFEGIKERLREIAKQERAASGTAVTVAGGTDLYVQKHDSMHHAPVRSVFNDEALKGVRIEGDQCIIGGAATAADLMNSAELKKLLPELEKHLLLVSSTPIRNMGTLAGNFVNASPIGDLTAMFIALDSTITLNSSAIPGQARNDRAIKLKDLYKGYKQLDKSPEEIVRSVSFKLPTKHTRFHFEKVSKRTYLDIASVNSAIRLEIDGDTIREAHVSAGGVAPVPKYLANTSTFLAGKPISFDTVRAAIKVMNEEIAPISDARGTADYKRLLLRQLFFAHFMQQFPERFTLSALIERS